MPLSPFLALLKENKFAALLKVNADVKPFYRLTYLTGMQRCGLLQRLAAAPSTFDEIAGLFPDGAKNREALQAWLQVGRKLGLLADGPQGYALDGMAKKLAEPQNDAALAMVEEIADLHHKLLMETPERIRAGDLFTLADQDGKLIARSSRVLEAFQVEAIRRTFPSSGAIRLLEVGCGSGFYIHYAAMHNRSLTARGLELQPDVAVAARANIAAWGLADRVDIVDGDVRAHAPEAVFDVVTLYNNIYYFPVDERVALFRHLAKFLKPGGFLLAVTCCQGGSVAVEALNLWGAATEGAGRLPAVDEMAAQLREGGFAAVNEFRLAPGESFWAFQAKTGGPSARSSLA